MIIDIDSLFRIAAALFKALHNQSPTVTMVALDKEWTVSLRYAETNYTASAEALVDAVQLLLKQLSDVSFKRL